MGFIATNSEALQIRNVGGGRGWGNIVASSSCYFVKEKHQTQPIELKCLAHEICDSVGEGCFGSVFI